MTAKPKATRKPFSFVRLGLKNKLIAIVIVVGTVPLILAMIFSYLQAHKSLIQVIGASFQALAYETSTKIDLLLKEEIHKTAHLASHPTLVLSAKEQNKFLEPNPLLAIGAEFSEQIEAWKNQDALSLSPTSNRASAVLKDFLNNEPYTAENTQALFVTDAKGVLVSSINFNPSFMNIHLPSWKKIMAGKLETFIGSLVRDPREKDRFIFEIAVPLKDNENRVVGVLHHIYAASEFFTNSLDPITFGTTGHVMLINSDGVVLTCPILPTGHQLADPKLVKAVTGPAAAWAQTQGDGHGSEDLSIIGYSPLEKTSRFTKASSNQRWYTFAWQSSDELFAPTQSLMSWVSVAGMFSVLLIVILGSLAANRIVRPIQQLQRTAESIGRGETVEPLIIDTGDEIESLADEINTMSGLLQKMFLGLEHQVEAKTQEVLYLKKYTESILMGVPEIILIFDSDLKIEYANAAFKHLNPSKAENCIGRKLNKVLPEYREAWTVLEKDLATHRSGDQYERTSSPTDIQYKAKDPLAPKDEGLLEESRNTITLGEQVYVYQFFDVVLEEEKEQRIGLILKDITEEKRLLEKLMQADKLSGLGTLAAGIAHEMNNPLYSIMGFTEAILEEKQISKIQPMAQKVLDRAKHMASIILNLSGYTRSNNKDAFKEVDVNERIEVAIEMALMSSYANEDISLEKNYGVLPTIKAKPEEIQQVFLNIIQNAIQAMEGKGELSVSSQNHNGFIVIQIQDTGPGIPQEYLSKVFDPFFTTKGQGEGTGLGLNIVHQVVGKYGGNIKVDSEASKGTTFIISLPINGETTN